MTHNREQDFIKRLTEVIEANLQNHQFGVDDLASEMGVSRSYLHRHLKRLGNQTISQFIRSVRLEKAREMLLNEDIPASDIAYRVGFSSPAYFSHCFHEEYGFPPGEMRKRAIKEADAGVDNTGVSEESVTAVASTSWFHRNTRVILYSAMVIVVTLFLYLLFSPGFEASRTERIISPAEKSIVVLPFKNYSGSDDNQYFADGITEDILNSLFHVTALRIVSRTSSEQFRDTHLSVPEIAELINVRYALEGSVRLFGDKTRISVQLIDARTDDHLWSSNYDRDYTDIIGIQSDIATDVARSLNAVISEEEARLIEKVPTRNAQAYDLYLRARFLLHKSNSPQRADFDKTGVLNCIQYYEKAIAADTLFADAYAGLANAWFNLSAWGIIPTAEGRVKGLQYSRKALEIDPDCAEAHAVLGVALVWSREFNLKEGGAALKKAIDLNPNFSTARQWYAQYLMITGPIEEARRHVDKALELEQYFWVVQNLSAWIYYFEEKYDKSLESCRIAYDLKPDFSDNAWLFILNYVKLGEGEKAVKKLQELTGRYPVAGGYADELALSYSRSGIPGLFEWLIDINKNRPVPIDGMTGHPFFIAWWNAILMNHEETIYWLERALEDPRPLGHYFNLIATNPDFDFLRDDPRFLQVIDKKGLTPYHTRRAK
jgi:TolB-like protein/AraC-like DNA-binding protein